MYVCRAGGGGVEQLDSSISIYEGQMDVTNAHSYYATTQLLRRAEKDICTNIPR